VISHWKVNTHGKEVQNKCHSFFPKHLNPKDFIFQYHQVSSMLLLVHYLKDSNHHLGFFCSVPLFKKGLFVLEMQFENTYDKN